MGFEQALEFGQAGESTIARWLRSRNYVVFPAYEKILDTGKGPRLFLPHGVLVAPDFLTWNGKKVRWVETKHKTAFTWHRLTNCWTTGIDLSQYEQYLQLSEIGPWPIWLLFLHDGGQAKDSPPNSPKGLFGNDLDYLRKHENHRSQEWGHCGMVYWAVKDLKSLSADIFESCSTERKRVESEMDTAEWYEDTA